MKGVRSWCSKDFHPKCQGVVPVDIGGFAHLWCPDCRVLANLEAVSIKDPTYSQAKQNTLEREVAKAVKEGVYGG